MADLMEPMSPAVAAAVLWLGTRPHGLRETAEIAVLAAAPHIAAKALRDMAAELDENEFYHAANWVSARADEIEGGSDV